MNKDLIFTATYNEKENIGEFINNVFNLNIKVDLLIIDDNSPDKTWEIIQTYQNKFKNIILIKREKKMGLDTANKLAFNFAKNKNYKNFISLDADLSHDPKMIPIFLNELNLNAFVIGSRYIKGGENHMNLKRYLLSYLGNKLIKFITNIDVNEFTTSFRGFNLKMMHEFDLNIVRSKGYSFFMETIFRINKSGYKIKEIPIVFKDRTKGYSKIPKIETFRTLKNLFLLKFFN